MVASSCVSTPFNVIPFPVFVHLLSASKLTTVVEAARPHRGLLPPTVLLHGRRLSLNTVRTCPGEMNKCILGIPLQSILVNRQFNCLHGEGALQVPEQQRSS